MASVGSVPPALPATIVPSQVGPLRFQREPSVEGDLTAVGKASLLSAVRVFTARRGPDIQGYLEFGVFKPDYPATRVEVRRGVLDDIGDGAVVPTRLGSDIVFEKQGQAQSFLIWFPPNGRYFDVLVAGHAMADPEQLFSVVLATQQGESVAAALAAESHALYDPRRGGQQ